MGQGVALSLVPRTLVGRRNTVLLSGILVPAADPRIWTVLKGTEPCRNCVTIIVIALLSPSLGRCVKGVRVAREILV